MRKARSAAIRVSGCAVIESGQIAAGCAVVRAAQDAERPLADGGNHHLRFQHLGNPVPVTQALQTSYRQDNSIKVAAVEPAQSRVHVSTKGSHMERRVAMPDLNLASQAARTDSCARRKLPEPVPARQQSITRIFTLGHRRHLDAGRQLRRYVFEAVDRHVNPPIEERLVDLLGEEPFTAKLGQRNIEDSVTCRPYDDGFDP